MTTAIPYSRSLAQQLWYRSTRPFTRPGHSNSLLRVSCTCSGQNYSQISHNSYSTHLSGSKQGRTYATAAAKTTRKPKAASVRTAATKKTTTTKRSTKKPTAKNAVRKPKKKAAAKKPKPKKIRVKKAPTKTALAQKARLARADLRQAALLDQPKQLPATAFTLLLVNEAKSAKGAVSAAAKTSSAKYKALSAEDRERLNHEANQNAEKNALAYKEWVQSHTPLQIKKANNARRQLTAKAKAAGQKISYRAIHDDRIVKQSRTAYSFFCQDRFASGDFAGISIAESGTLVGKEWHELSESAKKPYIAQADADKTRYLEEHKSVYGVDPPSVVRRRKTT
ncbi:hypothetical protein LTR84_001510 [Exophiala bonariae]|uniref:HMG box domain-containing protein n=1 Tax=Exophiala bonariae TaxID=1690606 RepID=A0AAV9NG80_9EURO|nr:hypothetical protein LTR84_001510 [Exophiala bonariae]